jgi:hypothetical protein
MVDTGVVAFYIRAHDEGMLGKLVAHSPHGCLRTAMTLTWVQRPNTGRCCARTMANAFKNSASREDQIWMTSPFAFLTRDIDAKRYCPRSKLC